MMKLVKRLWKEEEGQGLVEYALILALIAVVVVVTVKQIGTNANTKFETIKNNLQ